MNIIDLIIILILIIIVWLAIEFNKKNKGICLNCPYKNNNNCVKNNQKNNIKKTR